MIRVSAFFIGLGALCVPGSFPETLFNRIAAWAGRDGHEDQDVPEKSQPQATNNRSDVK